jgi:ribosomal-protein-alanine N-acetyltransferase
MARKPLEIELSRLERLSTARLTLRPPLEGDEEAVFAYASDLRVCRYLAWPCHEGLADTRRFLRTAKQGWQDGNRLSWAIEDSSGLVGMLGTELGRVGAGIGYVLAHDAWGKGYASEALAAVCEALFSATSLHSLWAFCVPENAASARVLEKCGFQREGLLPRYFACPNLGGEKHDVLLFVRHRG